MSSSHPLPFPSSSTSLQDSLLHSDTSSLSPATTTVPLRSAHHPINTSSNAPIPANSTWHHHPRQPGPQSDSYFPGAQSTSGTLSKQPSFRSHSRATSSSIAGLPPTTPGSYDKHSMTLNLADRKGETPYTAQYDASEFGGPGTGQGPPSPSTLTDAILRLHATLYGGKRSPAEVEEMVMRYYESNAVFSSPILSAHGREQIANQFIMAFALPGMDVTSELRDVICSDFEFDGTRAGIIDQTITVTFFPSLFGPNAPTSSGIGSETGAAYAYDGYECASAYPMQSAYTPHPFASYSSATPAASGFARSQSHPHSPATPFSLSSMWGGAGNSRPHTPGGFSGMRPLSAVAPHNQAPDEADDSSQYAAHPGNPSHFMAAEDGDGGGQLSRPSIPEDLMKPHWSAEGLGRRTFHNLVWSLFHPREVLKHVCSIKLHLMSRLEFNDAGLIVKHEDMWGLRETIEGVIPFASVVYAIERRLVGFVTSWAVAKGFKLSAALLRRTVGGGTSQYALAHKSDGDPDAHEAAVALLDRPPHGYSTISRSRTASPTRYRFGSFSSASGVVTGTRSRTRSLAGSTHPLSSSRAVSTDNLVGWGAQQAASHGGGASGYDRSDTLPPDAGAKYRSGTKRLEGGAAARTSSTASAPASSIGEPPDMLAFGAYDRQPWERDVPLEGHKGRAPDRDS